MNMVIPNEGKAKILEEIWRNNATREPSMKLDLFQNNVLVVDASTAADFVIATFTGYVQLVIARSGWMPAAVVANVGEMQTTAIQQFTCTGGSPQTVYGWILRGTTSGLIYAGQNFDIPRVMSTGVTEQIDPFKIKCKTFA